VNHRDPNTNSHTKGEAVNGTAGKVIAIKGAREHNLKDIDITIPRDQLVIITGLSGSGKSSLAFDTIYAEGQRRYVESLSAYARQFLEQMDKPDVDLIEGLSPAISIEQKTTSKNPRSTVGTVTEVYDYLRLLFARVGTPHCYRCGRVIASQTVQQIVDQVMQLPATSRIQVLAPLVRGRKGEYRKEIEELRRQGYTRARVDGQIRELTEKIELDKMKNHTIEAVIDRLVIKSGIEKRLADSIETAMNLADGIVTVDVGDAGELVFSEKFACITCGISYAELSPRLFSFNSPHGACPECDGLGFKQHLDVDFIIPDRRKSLRDGAIKPWEAQQPAYLQQMLEALANHYDINLDMPFEQLSPAVQDVILNGSRGEKVRFFYEKGGKRHYYQQEFEGVVPSLERKYLGDSEAYEGQDIESYISLKPCARCQGTRLRPESLAVKIAGKSIAEVTAFSVREAQRFFQALQLTSQQLFIAERVLKEIRERLKFLVDVGLDYLTLDRSASTLSGGGRPAHPLGDPDRFEPGRGALYSGRAQHRLASARQSAPARNAGASARHGEHGHRRRTRPGHHPGWRLRHRPRPRSRRPRRLHRGTGDARGDLSRRGLGDRPVSLRPPRHRRATAPPFRQWQTADPRGCLREQSAQHHCKHSSGSLHLPHWGLWIW
jgi:excinuclease ABC subunit A